MKKSSLHFNSKIAGSANSCICHKNILAVERLLDLPWNRQRSEILDWHILQLDRLGPQGVAELFGNKGVGR